MNKRFIKIYNEKFKLIILTLFSIAIGITICYILIYWFIHSNSDTTTTYTTIPISNLIQKDLEQAYFEGQQEALNGDVRIKKTNSNKWIWIRSPWNKDTNNPNWKDSILYNP